MRDRTHESTIWFEVELSKDNYAEYEFDILAHFEYQPEEKEVRYYADGSGYPGCAAEINVYDIECIETECPIPFHELLDNKKYSEIIYDRVENNIWDELERNADYYADYR